MLSTRSQTAEPRSMVLFIMLGLFALSSFGVTGKPTRVWFGNESHSETGEVEETVVVSSQRRPSSPRTLDRLKFSLVKRSSEGSLKRGSASPRAIEGHRFANGLLAPVRC